MLARHSSHVRRESGHAKIDTVSARPSRRLLLTGALALSATALTGCGVRLEDDAPDIPFVPKREPIPAETALLAMLGALDASAEPRAAQRADLLRKALTDAQVPTAVISGAKEPSSDAETVAAFEASVRECGPGMLKLVGQLTATHRITTGLGEDKKLWTPATTKPWRAGAVAADALKATTATLYALDLIAAQSKGAVAKDALTASERLRRLSIRQTTAAGDAVKPVSLGYERPKDLSGTKAHDWGVTSFIRLQAAYADGLERLGQDRDAALEVTQWMVTVHGVSRAQFLQDVPELYGDGTPTS